MKYLEYIAGIACLLFLGYLKLKKISNGTVMRSAKTYVQKQKRNAQVIPDQQIEINSPNYVIWVSKAEQIIKKREDSLGFWNNKDKFSEEFGRECLSELINPLLENEYTSRYVATNQAFPIDKLDELAFLHVPVFEDSKYQSSGRVEGQYRGRNFFIANMQLSHVVKDYDEEEKKTIRTKYQDVNGRLTFIPWNRNMIGSVYLTADIDDRLGDGFGQTIAKVSEYMDRLLPGLGYGYEPRQGLNYISFPDEEFNRWYKVKANQDIEAYELLNIGMRKALVNLCRRVKQPMSMVLNSEGIYIINMNGGIACGLPTKVSAEAYVRYLMLPMENIRFLIDELDKIGY